MRAISVGLLRAALKQGALSQGNVAASSGCAGRLLLLGLGAPVWALGSPNRRGQCWYPKDSSLRVSAGSLGGDMWGRDWNPPLG